jgi:lipid-A-disaccharide synthase
MHESAVQEADPVAGGDVHSDILIVAGEASGDLHAARLLTEIQRLNPTVRAFGLGGLELRAAGMDLVANSTDISVVGITEALRILPRARQIFRLLLDEVERRNATSAVLIDFPEFNLRLAKALKKRGLKVVYYISPQIWAWRRRRVQTISRVVDAMLVVLPFEVDFYRKHGVTAIHVGHPLVDEVPKLTQIWDTEAFPTKPIRLALLPGSRSSEIRANLPVMLESADLLARQIPLETVIIRANSIEQSEIEIHLASTSIASKIVSESRFEEIARSHLALCASGTATLEVGLLTTPMVVIYRVHTWTYLLGRILVRLPFISLVNLVLSKPAVPELIQDQATPARISQTANTILADRDRIDRMRQDLAQLRSQLGESGASEKAAVHVMNVISEGGDRTSQPKREPSQHA